MVNMANATRGIALIWAGLAIGGSMIATPAKFLAPSLTLPVALDVGRVQLFWIGIGEALLCACLLVALAWNVGARSRWLFFAVLLFTAQRLALMPALDEHTLRVIAGEPAGSSLHAVYVFLEVIKVVVLLVAGLASDRRQRKRVSVPDGIEVDQTSAPQLRGARRGPSARV